MTDPEGLLAELGAGRTRHSGRTLLDHLVGTRDLLRAWGERDAVQLGGLFHSVYGTNAFRAVTTGDRDLVRACIGAEAELLAHRFCTIDRPACLIADPLGHGHDLLVIELANLQEQRARPELVERVRRALVHAAG